MVVNEEAEEFTPLFNKFLKSNLETRSMFLANYGQNRTTNKDSQNIMLATKIRSEYERVKKMKPPTPAPRPKTAPIKQPVAATSKTASSSAVASPKSSSPQSEAAARTPAVEVSDITESIDNLPEMHVDKQGGKEGQLVAYQGHQIENLNPTHRQLLIRQRQREQQKPTWHAPWKLMRVISGHLGWVRCAAVDPANEWFCTGAGDRTIKIWDLASGTLKLTLTGHISSVRGLAVSSRSPYLFSVAEDKQVKCWDLEYNKVVRNYHGHLSGVYSCALHPTVDVLMTGGRDSTCRVWDIRTKAQVRVLAGHVNTVAAIATQPHEPQVITGSHDSTIRCWDLTAGKASAILTNHKKSVRALGIHPKEYTFYSGSADNMKVWKCPKGEFLRNISSHNAIVNSMTCNSDNVLVSGADNGTMKMWDWKSGYNFQTITAQVQPGSLDSENGIFACTFDQTGSRLITCEADKTIKIYKEDETATEESHPMDFKPNRKRNRF